MTRKGVWDLQQVRDKYLDVAWENYGSYYSWGSGNYGQLVFGLREQNLVMLIIYLG